MDRIMCGVAIALALSSALMGNWYLQRTSELGFANTKISMLENMVHDRRKFDLEWPLAPGDKENREIIGTLMINLIANLSVPSGGKCAVLKDKLICRYCGLEWTEDCFKDVIEEKEFIDILPEGD